MSTEVKKDSPPNVSDPTPVKSPVEAHSHAADSSSKPPPASSQDTSRDKFSNPGAQITRPPIATCFALDFFAPRAIHCTRTIIVNPDKLDDFVNAVYKQLEQLCNNALPLTQAQYLRMIKTFILKRVQDVHEKCINERADNYVRFYRNIILPKPVYDLAVSLGRGFNIHDGYHYFMTPCAKPSKGAPDYWTIDEDILAEYQRFSRRMSPMYQHVEFPSSSDYDGRAIGCTRIETVDGRVIVRSSTPAATPFDGLVRVMNPDDFFTGELPQLNRCNYRITDEILLSSVRNAFVGSPVVDTNS